MHPGFADIILPFAVKGRFTYRIPDELRGKVQTGMHVNVQFGTRNIYAGVVILVHNTRPAYDKVRQVLSIREKIPPVNEQQLKLWSWISEYYMCSEGEVMKAALPSEKSINEYKPRSEPGIELAHAFSESELTEMLDKLARAPKQYDILSGLLRITGYPDDPLIKAVSRALLLSEARSSSSNLEGLIKKGILKYVNLPVNGNEMQAAEPIAELSQAQASAYKSILSHFNNKDIVLLHGVTSSGKTELYIHLIEEQLKKGKQVLYMLPEIALTTQIINRLKKHFGAITGVYHSRLNDRDKVEIWKKVAEKDTASGFRLILGVRSSVFLPFTELGLVIIDEEHDGSYKQQDPAPRYNGRDSAIMLAHIHKAKTILGSASPSIESYNNASMGKYGLAELKERYGNIRLPDIILANTREASKRKLMVSHFTPELLYSMDNALGKGEQIILFRNRRGFSSYIECSDCGWIPSCIQCAVHLTYHKSMNRLVCHYCGYTAELPNKCDNCKSTGIVTRGFGTEKIEDEIKIVFPSARVARMDQDTTKGKNSFNKIITAFEERKIDILIGTQMISKGLDFENLTIVGILNADNLLNYPDFRAHERSFQLMEQVSGRAGRRQKQGKVIIQTYDPSNRIIRMVLRHDYNAMFRMQSEERKAFNYPPFCRMVRISIKHRDRSKLNYFSDLLGNDLKNLFGKRVLGPESPLISQVQLWYIKDVIIKIEREKPPSKAKQMIMEAIERIEKEQGASSLRIAVDVDPY